MLDVDRGEDVDAGREQLLDVLVALGVAAAGRVGVGQLVDQRHLRPAREQRVEVHLLQHPAHVGHLPAGEDLEALEQGLGLLAAVGLDDADDDVDAPARAERLRLLQHLVGLADAGAMPRKTLSRPRVSWRAASSKASGEGRWSRFRRSATGHACPV